MTQPARVTISFVHVASPSQNEIRLTIDVAIELVNRPGTSAVDVRLLLHDAGFSRASTASKASVERLADRLRDLAPLLLSLPDLDGADAATLVNEQLVELPISPSIVDHGGAGPHIHWTPATATFDDQVLTDIVMAVAQELCDNGTSRFGRCAADHCERVFHDNTRNRSKRFCSDPRCASRTHTADHRARRQRT